jgi:hypothetical protein
MGMFDTIIVDPPFECSRCGKNLEIQTKHFASVMERYRVGWVVAHSPVLTGVVKDDVFCSDCHKAGREAVDDVFFVIWHSILAGVERSEAAAEARLGAVDRLDLIRWLDEAQRSETGWSQRFHSFYADVRKWHEHLAREASSAAGEPESEADRWTSKLFRLPQEILESEDPLGKILEEHVEAYEASSGWL